MAFVVGEVDRANAKPLNVECFELCRERRRLDCRPWWPHRWPINLIHFGLLARKFYDTGAAYKAPEWCQIGPGRSTDRSTAVNYQISQTMPCRYVSNFRSVPRRLDVVWTKTKYVSCITTITVNRSEETADNLFWLLVQREREREWMKAAMLTAWYVYFEHKARICMQFTRLECEKCARRQSKISILKNGWR